MFDTDALTPASEITARIARLKRYLDREGIESALILQNTDLFYFAGTIQQSHLYVPVDGDPLLMVRKSFRRARAESAIERILPLSSPRQIPDILRKNGYRLPRSIGLELDVLPTTLFQGFQEIFSSQQLENISPAIRTIRAVKSGYEIDRIRDASALADKVAACVSGELREGQTEIELAGRIEAQARQLGHQGIVRMRLWGSELFYGHLMAGPAAAVPSFLASPTGGRAVNPAVAQGPGFRPIQRNEPVLVDYVFAFNGYLSDHTRIFSLGDLPDDLLRAHAAMLAIQAAVKTQAKPGVRAADLYATALAMAAEMGYADHFMGAGNQRITFIGHGIGLELDEFPFLARNQPMTLQAGMVIALEPKLVFPGQGVVGIENTHLVTENGLERLTRFQQEVVVV